AGMEIETLEFPDAAQQLGVAEVVEDVAIQAPAVRVGEAGHGGDGGGAEIPAGGRTISVRAVEPDSAAEGGAGGIDQRYQGREEEAGMKVGPQGGENGHGSQTAPAACGQFEDLSGALGVPDRGH